MTHSSHPTRCQATLVDLIQLKGWTPHSLQRAVSALSHVCNMRADVTPDEETQLAIELTRWLGYSAQDDPESLVEYLDARRPVGESESRWDRLETLLAAEEPLGAILLQLQDLYPNLTEMLYMLLHHQLAPDACFGDLDEWHQTAVECLMVLATSEVLVDLFERISLLCWSPSEAFRKLVRMREHAFVAAASDAWPHLEWDNRQKLIEICNSCNLDIPALHELLFAIDISYLNYEACENYVDAIIAVSAHDPRLLERCEQLLYGVIVRALDDIERTADDDAKKCARDAGRALKTLFRQLSPTLRARAQQLGIRL